MKHALYLPPFGELSNPRTLIDIANRAEERGWDGLFLWDHVLRPSDEPPEIADVWVALAAIATVTSRIRIGPMVTPTARRRPHKLAREATTLDWLAQGRLTVGLGLGVDTSGELSRFNELVDPRLRGDALDEAAELVVSLWSGEQVNHHGTYFYADGVRFLPRPLQSPRIPLWFAARGEAIRPVRRAARYEGLFAIEVNLPGLKRMVGIIDEERGDHDGFDIAVVASSSVDLAEWESAGVTWAMWSFRPGEALDVVVRRIEQGPTSDSS